jgi:hypothetical protein
VNASALRTSVWLTMVRCSRYGSSGARLVGDRSKPRPVAAGDQRFFCWPIGVAPADPCTISIAISRSFDAAAPTPVDAYARAAGSIASRNGSAMVPPIDLSTVRRDRCFPVMNDDIVGYLRCDLGCRSRVWPSSVVRVGSA